MDEPIPRKRARELLESIDKTFGDEGKEVDKILIALRAAYADGLEKAAKIARERGKLHDIDWWHNSSKREISRQTAIDLAELIEQQAKEMERLKNILAYIADCQPDGKQYLDEAQALSADYCDEQRQERDTARQDAARLRVALEALWRMTAIYKITDLDAHAVISKALKGA